jgi:hypothetical protein
MLTPSLPHVHFFHFSDTCSLDSNGLTKFLKSLLSLIPFQRADPALVLECYVPNALHPKMPRVPFSGIQMTLNRPG